MTSPEIGGGVEIPADALIARLTTRLHAMTDQVCVLEALAVTLTERLAAAEKTAGRREGPPSYIDDADDG